MIRLGVRGFSLVELMIVVAIIGVLSSIAIPNFQRFSMRAKQVEAKAHMSSIFTAEKAVYAEAGIYFGNLAVIGYVPIGKNTYSAGFAVPTGPLAGDLISRAPAYGYIQAIPNVRNRNFNTYMICNTTPGQCTGPGADVGFSLDNLNHAITNNGRNFAIGAAGKLRSMDLWQMTDAKVITQIFDGTY